LTLLPPAPSDIALFFHLSMAFRKCLPVRGPPPLNPTFPQLPSFSLPFPGHDQILHQLIFVLLCVGRLNTLAVKFPLPLSAFLSTVFSPFRFQFMFLGGRRRALAFPMASFDPVFWFSFCTFLVCCCFTASLLQSPMWSSLFRFFDFFYPDAADRLRFVLRRSPFLHPFPFWLLTMHFAPRSSYFTTPPIQLFSAYGVRSWACLSRAPRLLRRTSRAPRSSKFFFLSSSRLARVICTTSYGYTFFFLKVGVPTFLPVLPFSPVSSLCAPHINPFRNHIFGVSTSSDSFLGSFFPPPILFSLHGNPSPPTTLGPQTTSFPSRTFFGCFRGTGWGSNGFQLSSFGASLLSAGNPPPNQVPKWQDPQGLLPSPTPCPPSPTPFLIPLRPLSFSPTVM